jgi:hypothetical protein
MEGGEMDGNDAGFVVRMTHEQFERFLAEVKAAPALPDAHGRGGRGTDWRVEPWDGEDLKPPRFHTGNDI